MKLIINKLNYLVATIKALVGVKSFFIGMELSSCRGVDDGDNPNNVLSDNESLKKLFEDFISDEDCHFHKIENISKYLKNYYLIKENVEKLYKLDEDNDSFLENEWEIVLKIKNIFLVLNHLCSTKKPESFVEDEHLVLTVKCMLNYLIWYFYKLFNGHDRQNPGNEPRKFINIFDISRCICNLLAELEELLTSFTSTTHSEPKVELINNVKSFLEQEYPPFLTKLNELFSESLNITQNSSSGGSLTPTPTTSIEIAQNSSSGGSLTPNPTTSIKIAQNSLGDESQATKPLSSNFPDNRLIPVFVELFDDIIATYKKDSKNHCFLSLGPEDSIVKHSAAFLSNYKILFPVILYLQRHFVENSNSGDKPMSGIIQG